MLFQKTRNKLIRISILIILISAMLSSTNQITQINAEQVIEPKWEYVAEEKYDIFVDGDLSDWDTSTPLGISLYNFSGTDQIIEATSYFAYNDSHLFGGFSLPNELGNVKGLELWFFGMEKVYDVVLLNAETNEGTDQAYYKRAVTITDSDIEKGKNNVVADTDTDTLMTSYEFSKDLVSKDAAGYDFDLAIGDSIAVMMNAWVNSSIGETKSPNFSAINTTHFNYLRLSIGYDSDQTLYITFPGNISTVGETISAPYVEVDEFISDGLLTESFWDEVTLYDFKLNKTFSTYSTIMASKSPKLQLTADVLSCRVGFAYDSENIYAYIQIEDDGLLHERDGIHLIFTKGENVIHQETPATCTGTMITPSGTTSGYGNTFVITATHCIARDGFGQTQTDERLGGYGMGGWQENNWYNTPTTTDDWYNYAEYYCPYVDNPDEAGLTIEPGDSINLDIYVIKGSDEGLELYTPLIAEDEHEKILIHPVKLENPPVVSELELMKNSFTFLILGSQFIVIVMIIKRKRSQN